MKKFLLFLSLAQICTLFADRTATQAYVDAKKYPTIEDDGFVIHANGDMRTSDKFSGKGYGYWIVSSFLDGSKHIVPWDPEYAIWMTPAEYEPYCDIEINNQRLEINYGDDGYFTQAFNGYETNYVCFFESSEGEEFTVTATYTPSNSYAYTKLVTTNELQQFGAYKRDLTDNISYTNHLAEWVTCDVPSGVTLVGQPVIERYGEGPDDWWWVWYDTELTKYGSDTFYTFSIPYKKGYLSFVKQVTGAFAFFARQPAQSYSNDVFMTYRSVTNEVQQALSDNVYSYISDTTNTIHANSSVSMVTNISDRGHGTWTYVYANSQTGECTTNLMTWSKNPPYTSYYGNGWAYYGYNNVYLFLDGVNDSSPKLRFVYKYTGTSYDPYEATTYFIGFTNTYTCTPSFYQYVTCTFWYNPESATLNDRLILSSQTNDLIKNVYVREKTDLCIYEKNGQGTTWLLKPDNADFTYTCTGTFNASTGQYSFYLASVSDAGAVSTTGLLGNEYSLRYDSTARGHMGSGTATRPYSYVATTTNLVKSSDVYMKSEINSDAVTNVGARSYANWKFSQIDFSTNNLDLVFTITNLIKQLSNP